MSAGNLFVLPWVSPLDNGAVVPLSTLTFSLTGTDTLTDTYSDSALTVSNSNPVDLDSEGVCGPIYLDPTVTYRVTWKDSQGALIRPALDDIVGGSTVAPSYRLQDTAPSLVFEETDASANNGRWRIHVNGEVLTIDLGNDAESVWTNVVSLDRNGVLSLVDPNGIYGAHPVVTGESGSFTGTLTGMTATITGSVSWRRNGSLISLFLGSAITGTSNTTAMTMTGVPTALRPSNAKSCACMVKDAAGTYVPAIAILSSSTITFAMLKSSIYDTAGFTNSGTKGLDAAWTMTYSLDSQPA